LNADSVQPFYGGARGGGLGAGVDVFYRIFDGFEGILRFLGVFFEGYFERVVGRRGVKHRKILAGLEKWSGRPGRCHVNRKFIVMSCHLSRTSVIFIINGENLKTAPEACILCGKSNRRKCFRFTTKA
jgi:hypothetical protein